ncbi:hypothetical protein [Amaricoccus tamworthensis]|uniref:hypothetical protein n=1 Tax=Amaricoccus tamworthensis TaxID=57002 RepID=UPI003C7BFDB1
MLALAAGASSLYEPFGPTGFREISQRFPIIGSQNGLSSEQVAALIEKIAGLRGRLHGQTRSGQKTSLRTVLLGSRTKHSFRLARIRPWLSTIIWKDPHAIMLVSDIVETDIPVVVTARRARAHAGSYKRLGWQSRAAEIYPRWRARFGADPLTEKWLENVQDPVVSGALIWRMSYLPLVRAKCLSSIEWVTADDLEADEERAYRDLYRRLSLKPTSRFETQLRRRRRASGAAIPRSGATHDWARSVEGVNAYWKDLLTPEDVSTVDSLTADLEATLFARRPVREK